MVRGRPVAPDLRKQRILANDCRTCPKCGNPSSRRIATRREVQGVHRRRECTDPECSYRWTTIEIDLDRAKGVLEVEKAIGWAVYQIRKAHPSLISEIGDPLEGAPTVPESVFEERDETYEDVFEEEDDE